MSDRLSKKITSGGHVSTTPGYFEISDITKAEWALDALVLEAERDELKAKLEATQKILDNVESVELFKARLAAAQEEKE